MYKQVIDFNHIVLGITPRELGPMPSAEAVHLIRALHEEAVEFEVAYNEGDFIKQIDSLMDGMYFALGGLYKMGLSPVQAEKIFEAIHTANMKKRKGIVDSRAVEGAADAVKPENWTPPEETIAHILDNH